MAFARSADSAMERRMRLASRISNAYGLALLLTLLTFFVTSLLPHEDWSRIVVVAMIGLTSIVGLASSGVTHPRIRLAFVVTVFGTAAAIIAAFADPEFLMAVALALMSGLLLVTAFTILSRVLFTPTVTFRTILGALTTYTMLGMLFAFTYLIVDELQSGAFFTDSAALSDGQFLFFSYTTLTTTGYGDLVPAGQPGQSIAVLEMLTGQIFLVTLVAGLVSLWRPSIKRESGEHEEPRRIEVGD